MNLDLSFLGRTSFRQGLVHRLGRASVLLEGARGIGKTRVIEHLAASPPAGVAVLHFDLQGVASAGELVTRMAERVELRRTRVEDWLAAALGGWRKADPWDSLEALLSHRAPEVCWILFDEVALYLDQQSRRDRERARSDLARLDRLRTQPSARFLLTGSVTLRSVARSLGASLSPDWIPVALPPLDLSDGATLFTDACLSAIEDEAAHAGHRWAGGSPRWIKRLGQSTVGPANRALRVDDVDAAVDRLLDQQPFALDLEHLARHAEPANLRRALALAAAPGTNRLAVLAGLQATGLSRAHAQDTLEILRDEFYLDDAFRVQLPLFAEWLRRRA